MSNCVLADPLSVATQGVLDEDIGITVLGWIIRVPLDTEITIPTEPLLGDSLREWWVRKYFFVPPIGEFVLEGPFNYTHADQRARDVSDENESGLTELVTYYEDDKLYVVYTYLRGTKRYQGQRAYQAAMYNLPPTM
jgi:hypothetical protein